MLMRAHSSLTKKHGRAYNSAFLGASRVRIGAGTWAKQGERIVCIPSTLAERKERRFRTFAAKRIQTLAFAKREG